MSIKKPTAYSEGELILGALEAGYNICKNEPCSFLTDEANARYSWTVDRSKAPYEALIKGSGIRVWQGATAYRSNYKSNGRHG
jgi:hypothetical protein